MYLDMVHERCLELKSIAQFVDNQAKAKKEKDLMVDTKAMAGLGSLIGIIGITCNGVINYSNYYPGEKKKPLKKMPSCAALLGKAEEEETSDLAEAVNTRPFEMSDLKARAFKLSQKEREEEMQATEPSPLMDVPGAKAPKSKRRGSSRKS